LGEKKNIDPAAARDAVADLQNNPFDKAKQAIELARFILAGDPATTSEESLFAAAQATSAPSPDTVQKPAAE
jgi:hypothetical protein